MTVLETDVFVLQTGCMGGLSGLILAWANELTGNDNESMSSIPTLAIL